MPFSIVAWDESQDTGGNLTAVAAVADPHITVQGDDVRIPDFAPALVGVYAMGPTITRAQLQSPSLRRMLNYEVQPVDIAAQPDPIKRHNLFVDSPIPLIPDESLNAFVAEGVAGAEREIVLALLADGPLSPISGEIFQVRVTGATTLVANAWTNGALTFDQTLPVGEYAIVGAHFRSTGLLAFRFVAPGVAWRPGATGCAAADDLDLPGQRRGGWGEWLRFRNTTPPTCDWLSLSADTAETGVLDLLKVG